MIGLRLEGAQNDPSNEERKQDLLIIASDVEKIEIEKLHYRDL